MAELLTAIPAGIAVFQVIDRVVSLCKNYISSYRDAPADLRAILLETSSLKTLLENVEFLESCTVKDASAKEENGRLRTMIQECESLMKQIDELLRINSVEDKDHPSKRRRLNSMQSELAWPLKETKARKLLERLRTVKDAINLDLTAETRQDIRTIKNTVTEVQETLTSSERRSIYDWFKHTDPSQLYYEAKRNYEEGTGNWILRMPEWSRWLDYDFRCLWVHGIPGAGKTVLLGHLISEIQKHCQRYSDRNYHHLYYFCYNGHNQDEAAPLLKWLIGQLCRQSDRVPVSVQSMFRKGCEPALTDLIVALREALQYFGRLYLVIDALDESLPRRQLLEVMQCLTLDSRFQNLSILCSSREYADIEAAMNEISYAISMDNEELQSDIRIAVGAKVRSERKFKKLAPDLKDEVIETVSVCAKGMFRWAICQIDILRRLKIDSVSVKRQLANLPEDIEKTYDKIISMLSAEDRYVLCCLIKWIDFYVTEFEEEPCVQLLTCVASKAQQQVDNCKTEYIHDLDDLKELCGCLIRVEMNEQNAGLEDVDGTVYFAHYTVREYVSSSTLISQIKASIDNGTGISDPMRTIICEAGRSRSSIKGIPIASIAERVASKTFATFDLLCLIMFYGIVQFSWLFDKDLILDEDLFPVVISLLEPGIFPICHSTKSLFSGVSWKVQTVPDHLWDATHFITCVLCFMYSHEKPSEGGVLTKYLQRKGLPTNTRTHIKYERLPLIYLEYIQADDQVFEGHLFGVILQLFHASEGSFSLCFEELTMYSDPSDWIIWATYHHQWDGLDCCYCDYLEDYCRVEHLLELGADPNASYHGVTPLQIAVEKHEITTVKALLEAGADPNGYIGDDHLKSDEFQFFPENGGIKGLSPLELCRRQRQDYDESTYPQEAVDDIESMLLAKGAKHFNYADTGFAQL